MPEENTGKKNPIVQREEETLKFWQENRIFEKTLKKPSPEGDFTFYEGPPTANGRPGIHHLESRAFKDLIPRFKTMQGFYVRRKAGWDTHGLPVEIQVEKELGLKSKKEIEEYGIGKFNEKCKESVWQYIHEWEEFTDRIGYWIDLKHPYVTYKPYYIESLWNIVKKIDDQKFLYKDYKVLPWCPRCETALSSHELAQGYKDVKDLSVFVKFKLTNLELTNPDFASRNRGSSILNQNRDLPTYLVAWTTTPWTLPGNVALAVGEDITYARVEVGGEELILAKDRLSVFKDIEYKIVEELDAKKLIGLEYESLYPFLRDNLPEGEKEKLPRAFKVYPADFVTTEDGTGIVHTAVMYGQDDFELGTKENLPKCHLVNEDGTFKKETGFLSGKFVKDQETDVEIIKDLAHRGLLFRKEKYEHSYPHCWRCKTPLIYFARDSWYVRMSEVKEELIKENQKINWEPSYIKEGRFGEWLKDVKDWAISRERYWGTPLPVWLCNSCKEKKVIGSFEELFFKSKDKRLTRLVLLRHGQSDKNIPDEMFDSSLDTYGLTETGKNQAEKAAVILKDKKISAVYSSPVRRARETAEILARSFGKKAILDDRISEVNNGEWEGKKEDDPSIRESRFEYNALPNGNYYKTPRGLTGESWEEVEKRMADFAEEIVERHKGETVVIISHEGPLMLLLRYLKDLSFEEITNLWEERRVFHQGLLGSYAEPVFVFADSKTSKEIDPHRPHIDEFKLSCECGGEMTRTKEVMDVWFDSGAMPFAEDHYPFKTDTINFPADFISEAIDQTRGWFYTLHALGILMGKGRAYKNVISLGHLLDAEGKKMSKSLGNIIVPKEAIEKFGVDTLRFWMYSVNQPGESKNFDEKTIDEVTKKVVNPLSNVLSFLKMYGGQSMEIKNPQSKNYLDIWICAYLSKLTAENTKNLLNYKITEAARNLREFILDLSQWYLKMSRNRFKSDDENEKKEAIETLEFVLKELSKLLAPFMPFLSEYVYQEIKTKNDKESVHLEEWPVSSFGEKEQKILDEMSETRRLVSVTLEERAKAGIKIRQPLPAVYLLPKLAMTDVKGTAQIIMEAANVKKVFLDDKSKEDVRLDINITPELKLEGDKREFVRQIQELRKENNLKPGEYVNLLVDTDLLGKNFVNSAEDEVLKTAQIKEIKFQETENGKELKINETKIVVQLEASE